MKDIKEYFCSLSKPPKEECKRSTKSLEQAAPNEVVDENLDSNKDESHKKKKRKKKKRKHSDRAVRDVTQLLSNSLKLVSPGKTPLTKIVDLTKSESVVHEEKSALKENEENNENPSLRKNAFQFMMANRDKIIGLNSSGKELDDDDTNTEGNNKEKLAAKRQIFSNWSNQKGALKRKRLEEEKDEIIDHKLKKRAKKLKNMLNIDDEEKFASKKPKKKRKRIKKLSSSGEDSDFESKVALEKETEEKKVDFEKKARQSGNKPKKSHNGKDIIKEAVQKDKKKLNKSSETDEKSTKQKNGNILSFIVTEEINHNNKLEENTDKDPIVEETPLKHRKHEKRRKKKMEKSQVVDESSQEKANFTPRTLRSWKMRIKINIDEDGTNKEVSDTIKLSSDSEDEREVVETKEKHKKIAPIFSKLTPKPKADPAVLKARREFLMSGIPSSLKKTIERHSVVEQQCQTFPITRHIQQKCDSHFWSLPSPELKLTEGPPLKFSLDGLKFEKITNSHTIRNLNIDTEVKKVDRLKMLLNKIKSENPHYPVYKSFRQINEKCGDQEEIGEKKQAPEKKKRGRKKKNRSVELPMPIIKSEPNKYVMWTEKYKPRCSDDITGNSPGVRNLKKWLEDWKNFSQEINSKKRNPSYSSESEFEATDGDSRDSARLPGKIVVLGGPCGSGKSTAVYAVCYELGFNVIELNASTKRTGKRLLQEIQEATQSHQVRNSESQNFQNFFQFREMPENSDQTEKKMCVLLVEDVDIVFEQDDGFISALMQLATTSKRPIILTTSNYDSVFVQKFLNQYKYIAFAPLSSYSLAIWMQILCLCEGLYVSQKEIGSLLEYNKGDARKTLLQFQFWVQSGGQITRNSSSFKIEYSHSSSEENLEVDEGNETLEASSEEVEVFQHKNCFRSFEILEIEDEFKVPFYLNLGLLWWNIPNVLNIPNFSKQRISKTNEKDDKENQTNKRKLLQVAKFYDSFCLTDVIFKKMKYFDGNEPLIRNNVDLKDSLELGEAVDNQYKDLEFIHELTHTLIDGHIKSCTEESRLNVAMPEKAEKRWRSKLKDCEIVLQDALSLSTERASIALDYMPVLRAITRSETSRAANNTKRGNRFRNYLRELGVHCNENVAKVACNILNEFIW